MSTNAVLQKYKDFSIKYNHGEPATIWELYRHSVINELENLEVKEAKRAYDLWNKSFTKCLDILPRSKDHIEYYFYWNIGFDIIIITEDYKCGINVIMPSRSNEHNTITICSRLSFEDKNGEKIDKSIDSIDSFGIICKEVISLTNDAYDIFKPVLSAHKSIEDLIDLYYNHITSEGTYSDKVYKVDGKIIWEANNFKRPNESVLGWKI